MHETEIATALIRNETTFFMQRRDGPNQTGAIGLIGFWGGQILPGETIKEAAAREVSEETTLSPKPGEFGYDRARNPLEIPEVYKQFGFINRKGLLIAHVVTLKLIENPQIRAREGTLALLDASEVARALQRGQLLPVAETYFRRYSRELIDN